MSLSLRASYLWTTVETTSWTGLWKTGHTPRNRSRYSVGRLSTTIPESQIRLSCSFGFRKEISRTCVQVERLILFPKGI
jgi:hypothetical protein